MRAGTMQAVRRVSVAMAAGAALLAVPASQAEPRPPDVILIVTDDQRHDSMRYMPLTRQLTPVRFTQALVANPVCCPSRATILSGQRAEEHGVWSNKPPLGGYPAFAAWDSANTTLPEALNDTYHTGFAGKYFNAWDGSLPTGWDSFWGLQHNRPAPGLPYYGFSIVGTEPEVRPPGYVLDALTQRLTRFIATAPAEAPLFAYYALPAPHNAGSIDRPIPAPADIGRRVFLPPLPPSANEARIGDKPSYIAKRTMLSEAQIDRHRRATARTLRSADRSIAAVIAAQEARDPGLENTVIIFTSDNGLLDGEHRWTSKSVPYEEALRVPMRMYHPELGTDTIGRMVTNADVAATIASIAGVDLPTAGRSLLEPSGPSKLLIRGAPDTGHAFCGLRTARWKYVRYASGEVEIYDLRNDPWELRNLPGRAPEGIVGRALERCGAIGMPNWAA